MIGVTRFLVFRFRFRFRFRFQFLRFLVARCRHTRIRFSLLASWFCKQCKNVCLSCNGVFFSLASCLSRSSWWVAPMTVLLFAFCFFTVPSINIISNHIVTVGIHLPTQTPIQPTLRCQPICFFVGQRMGEGGGKSQGVQETDSKKKNCKTQKATKQQRSNEATKQNSKTRNTKTNQ